MSPTIFWSLISSGVTALVTLFGVYIAQRSGHLLFAVAKQEHDLNLRKASPIIWEHRHACSAANPERQLPTFPLRGYVHPQLW